jgi:hypothetical protein
MSAPTCSRCGSPLITFAELADVAWRAGAALESMRLALPSNLTTGVRLLAAALPCHAGTCRRREDR